MRKHEARGLGRYLRKLARTLSGEALVTNARGLLRMLGNHLSKRKADDIKAVLPVWRRRANMKHPPGHQAAEAISLRTLKALTRGAREKKIPANERKALDIFLVAFVTMSRVGEIATLQVEDVAPGGEVIELRPKTGARTWLKLRKKVSSTRGLRAAEALRSYRDEARAKGRRGLFCDKDNKPPTTALITAHLKRLSARLGLNIRISSHSARKGAAVEAVLAGVPLPVVQALGGWKDINTLQAYIGEALRRTVPWLEIIKAKTNKGKRKKSIRW